MKSVERRAQQTAKHSHGANNVMRGGKKRRKTKQHRKWHEKKGCETYSIPRNVFFFCWVCFYAVFNVTCIVRERILPANICTNTAAKEKLSHNRAWRRVLVLSIWRLDGNALPSVRRVIPISSKIGLPTGWPNVRGDCFQFVNIFTFFTLSVQRNKINIFRNLNDINKIASLPENSSSSFAFCTFL